MSESEISFSIKERIFYRDQLREARYTALADAEAFEQICWAIEALGKRLNGSGIGLGAYKRSFEIILAENQLIQRDKSRTSFDGLFEKVRLARNDAAHTGAYARHATSAAIELALLLESALMGTSKSVGDYMIKDVVTCEPWHLVAEARSAMLKNSFSYLPLYENGEWFLISDLAIAEYRDKIAKPKKNDSDAARSLFNLSTPIRDATAEQAEPRLHKLRVDTNDLLYPDMTTTQALERAAKNSNRPWLWLVVEREEISRLLGVLSPFELL